MAGKRRFICCEPCSDITYKLGCRRAKFNRSKWCLQYIHESQREKDNWDNSLDLGYGLLKQGEQGFRKTDDKIDLLSKYGRQAHKGLYYAALFNFKTQMQPGYKYISDVDKEKISNLLAPAYTLIALGFDYKPNSYFSAFVAP